jgi:hypothetical protein
MTALAVARSTFALSLLLLPAAANAEEFPYASQAEIVQACAAKAELPK